MQRGPGGSRGGKTNSMQKQRLHYIAPERKKKEKDDFEWEACCRNRARLICMYDGPLLMNTRVCSGRHCTRFPVRTQIPLFAWHLTSLLPPPSEANLDFLLCFEQLACYRTIPVPRPLRSSSQQMGKHARLIVL